MECLDADYDQTAILDKSSSIKSTINPLELLPWSDSSLDSHVKRLIFVCTVAEPKTLAICINLAHGIANMRSQSSGKCNLFLFPHCGILLFRAWNTGFFA